jgi:hypothetical protein
MHSSNDTSVDVNYDQRLHYPQGSLIAICQGQRSRNSVLPFTALALAVVIVVDLKRWQICGLRYGIWRGSHGPEKRLTFSDGNSPSQTPLLSSNGRSLNAIGDGACGSERFEGRT